MAYPKRIHELIEALASLPGIGPRQASRIAYALREKEAAFTKHLASSIQALHEETDICPLCFRTTEKREGSACDICQTRKDSTHILVVEKDSDLETFEKAGAFNGLYHVLGGTISPLEKIPAERLRIRELFERIKTHPEHTAVEVIIATSNTVEGNQTANYVERILEPLKIKTTRLGRGLSTGAEIEYADPLTLEQALKNRK